jgi:hypothetical protein
MASNDIESQTVDMGNKPGPGEVSTKPNNVFSTKLGNSDIVADLEIDVHLKIGENTELRGSTNPEKTTKSRTQSDSSDAGSQNKNAASFI